MKKTMLSVIVIICTVICVLIMLFGDKISIKQKPLNNKIEVINPNQNIESTKGDINLLKQDSSVEKDQSISEDKKLDNNTEKKSYIATEIYKKLKMDEINEEMEHDKKVFFEQNNKTVDVKKDTVENNVRKNELENSEIVNDKNGEYSHNSAPVFKVSKSKIKDSLTLSDKEKLLSIATKLSAVDCEKVNKYLETGSDKDIKSTIKLLKSRLSDKDYEKVRVVAEKFINMDAVEK